MRWLVGWLVAILTVLGASPVAAQQAIDAGIARLLTRVERALEAAAPDAFDPLLSPNAAPSLTADFVPRVVVPNVVRALVKEREREALVGALPGDGFRLAVDIFTETARTARILTAQIDVRRAAGDTNPEAWRLVSAQAVAFVEGLHRLTVNTSVQYTTRQLRVVAPDLTLTLDEGAAFPIESEAGMTGLVLIGRGEMQFVPGPESEREQLRLFAGAEALLTPFDVTLLRLNPRDVEVQGLMASLTPVDVDARHARRARDVFDSDAPRSFTLDLGDLSRDTWYLVPPRGDMLAEIHTRGRGHLTYARSRADAEDVSLFERGRGRDIARYVSPEKIKARSAPGGGEDQADFVVTDYEIVATIDPSRQSVDAQARLRVRVQAELLPTISLRLAEPLTVTSVSSPQLGYMAHVRVRTRDTLIINLPVALRRGREVTFVLTYSGKLPTQSIDQESLLPFGQPGFPVGSGSPEQYYLLSSKGYWYPQPSSPGYATATLRLTVPEAYGCVASGEAVPAFGAAVSGAGTPTRLWVFRAIDPVRYLAVVLSRFKPPTSTVIALTADAVGSTAPRLTPSGTRQPGFRVRDRVALDMFPATVVSQNRTRDLMTATGAIMRFYADLMGEAPYPSLSMAVVEHPLPGGHSPPYMVMLHNPAAPSQMTWRDDPAAFDDYPEFFLAHELAHQWWGQAVGWRNYHEQWLSEGFAQYFSALYAEHRYGEEGLVRMLRQFRRWTLQSSDQGPVDLGYRLGQIRGDKRAPRALIYNKAAGVLHMLRRLVGDTAFFNSLRRLYLEKKFEKAGSDDVQRAFEAETGQSLGRFFDRWIRGSRLPRLRAHSRISDTEVTIRIEQIDEVLFDVPVTVTLIGADGRSTDVMIAVTAQAVEQKIPIDTPLRAVRFNRDSMTLAEIEER